MLYGQDVFYFATVRKITAAFGALFTNCVISRYDQPGGKGAVLQTIKVPIAYGPANSWIRAYNETTRRGDKLRVRTFFPRMSFENVGIEYDPSRKLVTTGAVFVTNSSSNNLGTFLKQLNPVPYNFYFDLHITTKSIDDGLQVIEQILPNFTPSFNVTVKEIPELGIVRDVPVVFEGIDTVDGYAQNELNSVRTMTWTLHFKVKSYLYPTIKDAEIIKQIIASIYGDRDMSEESKQAIVTVSVDPIEAEPDDDWSVKTEIEEL